ncbi:hypothetical protein HYW53_01635 [Candidatus Giovannonibacteria bacterium]|nr:hypothetical protein [Candidatus Giovannonibacteria bacterium]
MPYIGVTGFMTPQEVRLIQRQFDKTSIRKLMVGVLVSSKTLKGLTNKYPRQFPSVGRVCEIFQNHHCSVNLIHYSSDKPDSLCEQLLTLVDVGGENLTGFQLNIAWPKIGELEKFRAITDFKFRIVLQVGREALLGINCGASEKVAEHLMRYADLIDDVLIDESAGTGKPLDVERTMEYFQEFREKGIEIGFGMAGGLGPETLYLVERVRDKFPDISFDAQKELRDKHTDDLDVSLTEDYVCGAIYLLELKKKEEEERKNIGKELRRENWKCDIGD